MYRYHFYDLKVHFWWSNKHFIWGRSSWKTLYWQKNPVFVKILELQLSFVLYKCLRNIWMVPSGLFGLVRSSWSRWGHLFSRVAIGSHVYLQLIHVNNTRAISKLNITKDYFSYYNTHCQFSEFSFILFLAIFLVKNCTTNFSLWNCNIHL